MTEDEPGRIVVRRAESGDVERSHRILSGPRAIADTFSATVAVADNWLDLSKVELHVYTDNAAGIALYKEFGFETKGTRCRFAFRNGRYVDAYSITRNGLRQDVGACCFVGAIEQPYEGRIGRGLTIR